MPDLVSSIRQRYLRVLDAMAASAQKSGRDAEAVRLVVVTKLQPIEVVIASLEAGVRLLGENYAEEALEKITALGQTAVRAAQIAVEWHMIGHVQSRKAQLVAEHFALVHSLDGLKLARRLDRAAAQLERRLPVLLEFNVSGEKTKHGWLAPDESSWLDLLPEVEAISALTKLKLCGLMTMPPLSTDPEAARTYFQRLRHLRDFLSERTPEVEWTELSMGTSAEYAVAVEEGATLVRVGQAILGPRPLATET